MGSHLKDYFVSSLIGVVHNCFLNVPNPLHGVEFDS